MADRPNEEGSVVGTPLVEPESDPSLSDVSEAENESDYAAPKGRFDNRTGDNHSVNERQLKIRKSNYSNNRGRYNNNASYNSAYEGHYNNSKSNYSDNRGRYNNSASYNSAYEGRYRNNRSAEIQRSRAMFPKDKYHKLTFPGEIQLEDKYRWSDKHGSQYQYEIAIPNRQHWWFKHIYVLRSYDKLIQDLLNGKIGEVTFTSSDIPPEGRGRKYKQYLCKGFPPSLEEEKLISSLGRDNIHSYKRMTFNGVKTSSVKIVWKTNDPPPTSVPLLGSEAVSVKIEVMQKSDPKCYKCQQIGHMASNCENTAQCPLCGGNHSLRECPIKHHKHKENRDTSTTSIKCYRCKKAGVNAWSCDCNESEVDLQSQPNARLSVHQRKVQTTGTKVLKNNQEVNDKQISMQVLSDEDKFEISQVKGKVEIIRDDIQLLRGELQSLRDMVENLAMQSAENIAHSMDSTQRKINQVFHEIANNIAMQIGNVSGKVQDNYQRSGAILECMQSQGRDSACGAVGKDFGLPNLAMPDPVSPQTKPAELRHHRSGTKIKVTTGLPAGAIKG